MVVACEAAGCKRLCREKKGQFLTMYLSWSLELSSNQLKFHSESIYTRSPRKAIVHYITWEGCGIKIVSIIYIQNTHSYMQSRLTQRLIRQDTVQLHEQPTEWVMQRLTQGIYGEALVG